MPLEIALTSKQTTFDRKVRQTENVFYGGAKGGGKSHGLREIMLKRRFEKPNSYGVIFRKTYPELYGNHIGPMFKKFPELIKHYDKANKELQLPNGSILAFRHCQYERDLGLHQGQEYQDLGIDEVGEWPEQWFWTLKGSNRSSDPNIKPRCLLTGNPGGIGHKWLKRLFVDRDFRPNIENPDDYAFVSAKVYDNPALMLHDPGYINRLRANKNELLVKAYLEGSWDLQAGQFFDMVSRETHVIKPFDIPDYWERIKCFDTGFNHPAGFIWMAVDTDGNVFVYREWSKAGKRTEEIVEEVMAHKDTLKDPIVEAGHDCWIKASRGGGPSVEEKFSEASEGALVLNRANIDRIAGAQQLRDYLVVRENGPRLKFFSDCPMTFDAVVRMTHDPKRPEDVLKVDATEDDPYSGDDLYDTLRYGLMSRPRISIVPPKPKRKRYYGDDEEELAGWQGV